MKIIAVTMVKIVLANVTEKNTGDPVFLNSDFENVDCLQLMLWCIQAKQGQDQGQGPTNKLLEDTGKPIKHICPVGAATMLEDLGNMESWQNR